MSNLFPLIAAVLGPVLSSMAWLTEKEALGYLHPVTAAACGPLFAGVLLLLYLWSKGKFCTLDKLQAQRKDLFLRLFLANVVGGLCMVYALSYTSSAKVIFLTKVEPYLIILWDWMFRGQRVSRYHLALLWIHIVGAILLSTGGVLDFRSDQFGDLLLLCGIAAHSLTYAPSRRLAQALGATESTALTQFLGGLAVLPLALYLGSHDFVFSQQNLPGWGFLCLSVLLYYVFSTLLWFYALGHFPSWILSALRCLGPVVAAPIAWLAFDQKLSVLQLVGAAIVIITSIMMVKSREDVKQKPA